jgi:hypothetical protein
MTGVLYTFSSIPVTLGEKALQMVGCDDNTSRIVIIHDSIDPVLHLQEMQYGFLQNTGPSILRKPWPTMIVQEEARV